jgi:hypothetical protein
VYDKGRVFRWEREGIAALPAPHGRMGRASFDRLAGRGFLGFGDRLSDSSRLRAVAVRIAENPMRHYCKQMRDL